MWEWDRCVANGSEWKRAEREEGWVLVGGKGMIERKKGREHERDTATNASERERMNEFTWTQYFRLDWARVHSRHIWMFTHVEIHRYTKKHINKNRK